jgi:hypothetical protein
MEKNRLKNGRFGKGHKETKQQKENRSTAMKKAWKSDPRKHGMMRTKFYNTWRSMTTRCRGTCGEDSKKKYRDKGIRVCDRWLDFKNFYEDMHPTYKGGLTIDRIHNSLGYFKENCRWATPKQQANNRHNTVRLNGKTLEEWADTLNISYATLRNRYYRKFKKGTMSFSELIASGQEVTIDIRDENKLL